MLFRSFGSDLDASTKAVIEHGTRLTELLKQGQYTPMNLSQEVIVLFAARHRFIKDVPTELILPYQDFLLRMFENEHADIMNEIETKKIISKELEETLHKEMDKITKQFIKMRVQ